MYKCIYACDDPEQYSDIPDHELDHIYKEITAADTNVRSRGVFAPQVRVLLSLKKHQENKVLSIYECLVLVYFSKFSLAHAS